MTGLVLSRDFVRHQTSFGHPECPERIIAVENALESSGLAAQCLRIEDGPNPWPWIAKNHDQEYITRLIESCAQGEDYIDSPDSTIGPGSATIAALAVQRSLGALDSVMRGEVRNAFCVVRPPGHHAEATHSMGFCLFNNVAILARYAQESYSLNKVLVLDWDVHHGNGTQHSFESDPTVYYMSFHGSPATLYPGTGWAEERGKDEGFGYTLNIPLEPFSTEREYRQAFQKLVVPEVKSFAPDLVLVSAGFDAHRDDPLGNQALDTDSFRWLTEEMLSIADTYAEGRLISLLEGGYDLHALGECCKVHLESLLTWTDAPQR